MLHWTDMLIVMPNSCGMWICQEHRIGADEIRVKQYDNVLFTSKECKYQNDKNGVVGNPHKIM